MSLDQHKLITPLSQPTELLHANFQLHTLQNCLLCEAQSEWIDYKFTPEDYVASNDKVVAYGTYTGTYKITGKSFIARVAHVWKLKDSKTISFEQFVDSQPVNDALK